MATKAQIQALINAQLASGQVGGISALQHRDVLKDDTDSILEAVYSAAVNDSNVLGTHTVSNANFDYEITIRKVGSQIIISGFLICNTTVAPNSTLFTISTSEYICINENYYTITSGGASTNNRLRIIDGSVFVSYAMFEGELHTFTLTYTALN